MLTAACDGDRFGPCSDSGKNEFQQGRWPDSRAACARTGLVAASRHSSDGMGTASRCRPTPATPPPAQGQKLHWAGPRPHCLAELGGVCFLSPSVRRSLLLLATCLLWLLLCGQALRSPGVRARPPPRPPPHGKPEAGCPPRRHLPPRAFGGDQGPEARSFEEPR